VPILENVQEAKRLGSLEAKRLGGYKAGKLGGKKDGKLEITGYKVTFNRPSLPASEPASILASQHPGLLALTSSARKNTTES
jgi:hypothetical protein